MIIIYHVKYIIYHIVIIQNKGPLNIYQGIHHKKKTKITKNVKKIYSETIFCRRELDSEISWFIPRFLVWQLCSWVICGIIKLQFWRDLTHRCLFRVASIDRILKIKLHIITCKVLIKGIAIARFLYSVEGRAEPTSRSDQGDHINQDRENQNIGIAVAKEMHFVFRHNRNLMRHSGMVWNVKRKNKTSCEWSHSVKYICIAYMHTRTHTQTHIHTHIVPPLPDNFNH